nr:hypothetical protein [uncultured Duganella sp.]
MPIPSSIHRRRLKLQQIASEKALTTQRQAATREAETNIMAKRIDTGRKLIPAIAFGYGISAAFIYFFLESNFFPSGVSFGDTLLFVFIAMGYALVALSFVSTGISAMLLPAAYLSKDPNKKTPVPLIVGMFVLSAAFPIAAGYLLSDWHWSWGPAAALLAALLCYGIAWKRGTQDGTDTAFNVVIQTVAWTFLAALVAFAKDSVIPLLIAAFLSGCTAAAALWLRTLEVNKGQERTARLLIAVLFSASMVIPLGFDLTQSQGALVSYVFTQLGFRSQAATVRLSGDALSSVRAAAATAGIDLAICYEDPTHASVTPVDVLWHGMGTRSLLSLGGSQQNGLIRQHTDDIEVAAEDLKMQRARTAICQDLRARPLFKSKTAVYVAGNPAATLAAEADRYFARVNPPSCVVGSDDKSCNWRFYSIIVSGHADTRPVKKDGNELLACQRAQTLLADLKKTEGKLGDALRAGRLHETLVSLGTRSSADSCKETNDQQSASECHAQYRHAQVRLIYARHVSPAPKHGASCASISAINEVYIETPPNTAARKEDPPKK